jgi:excisionase family DNA binding protein
LTLDEAAAMLSVNPTTVVKWIRGGRLQAIQICPNAPRVLRQIDVESFAARLMDNVASNAAKSKQLALQIQ